MNKLLKSAIDNLSIVNVSLRQSDVLLKDGLNHISINGMHKKSQSFRSVIKIEVIEVVKDGIEESHETLYSFHYKVGSRLVQPEGQKPTSMSEEKDAEAMVTIEACFEAIYVARKELEKEELEAFAANNVGYNVWPYWREYLQGTCSRMSIDPIKVPFYHSVKSDLPNQKSDP